MLSNIILRSTAAFGGAPFRLKKCTALGSAGGVPGALVGVGWVGSGISVTFKHEAGDRFRHRLYPSCWLL